MNFIEELSQRIDQRLRSDSPQSYVSKLNQRGLNRMAQKCGEEACEVIIAAKDLDAARTDPKLRTALIEESADLFFHHLLLLRKLGVSFDEVSAELQSRVKSD